MALWTLKCAPAGIGALLPPVFRVGTHDLFGGCLSDLLVIRLVDQPAISHALTWPTTYNPDTGASKEADHG